MENAQKALIIAAGLFLTIALITITVIIFNVASGAMGNTTENIDNTQKEMQQAQLTAIIGKKVSADTVKQTLRSIVTNDIKVDVTIGNTPIWSSGTSLSYKAAELSGTTIAGAIKAGKSYKVSATYGTDGSLAGITFTEQ